MKRMWAGCFVGALFLAGCGSDEPADLIQTKMGTSGTLEFTAEGDQVPAQGMNMFYLTLVDSTTRAAFVDAAVTIKPTMPAMGDGSEGAEAMDLGNGKFHIMNVNFTMAGQWEVAYDVTKDGAPVDKCAFVYDVP